MDNGNYDLRSRLLIENIDHLSLEELAINRTFLEAMNENHPLSIDNSSSLYQHIATDSSSVIKTVTSPESMLTKLKSLNVSKAPGPDGIPNWILKTYREILASPISNLLNSSYQQERLPDTWKRANITPIPKTKTCT